jgi:hypothetical protein
MHRAGLDTYESINWDSSGGRDKKGNLTFIPDVKALFLATTTTGDGEKSGFERKTDERIQGLKEEHKFKKILGIIPISARHDPNEVNELLGRDHGGTTSNSTGPISAPASAGGTLGDGVKSEGGVKSRSSGSVLWLSEDGVVEARVAEAARVEAIKKKQEESAAAPAKPLAPPPLASEWIE